ncbi:MAG: hypothetical protein Q9160_002550 [Pyrenula sp. 1 TL-2023]
MSYGGGQDPREYGGGGRQGDNYYDQSTNYSDRPSGGQGGYGGGYGEEERQHGGGGSGGYGGMTGGGYGNEDRYGGSGGGSGGYGHANYDEDEVVSQARRHGNQEDGNFFSSAMSFLGQNKHHIQNEGGVDEQQMVGAHQSLYNGGSGGGQQHSADSLGAGAAMQALKMFTGGGGGGGGGHSGGNSQSQFIGLAMGQAGKLFDEQHGQGNVSHGTDKQTVVNQAAKMALKMYMQSEGKGGGGGPGGLMGLASKFM